MVCCPLAGGALKVGRLGDYHPRDRCALCGADYWPGKFRQTIIRSTLAEGLVCIDVDGCLRRRRERRQLNFLDAKDASPFDLSERAFT